MKGVVLILRFIYYDSNRECYTPSVTLIAGNQVRKVDAHEETYKISQYRILKNVQARMNHDGIEFQGSHVKCIFFSKKLSSPLKNTKS